MSTLPTKPKKLSPTQLAKWLRTLPETMNLWELCDNGYTVQQANFALAHYAATKRAAIKLNEDLRAVDPALTASAESDAARICAPSCATRALLAIGTIIFSISLARPVITGKTLGVM